MKTILGHALRSIPALAVGMVALLAPMDGYAQQSGHNIPGDFGMQSGTQAPPGIYSGFIYYAYPTHTLKGENGEKVSGDGGGLTVTAPTAFVSWVTNKKFLGANIGGTLAVPFMKNRIEAFSLEGASNLNPSDIYVQPLTLGWHFKRADVIAGYGVFMPTGNFGESAKENSGLGMFSHELSVGTTGYLTKNRMWHASALMSYEMHTNKPGEDIKVGDLVTIEGGVGKTFVKPLANKPVPLVANVGVAYVTQFKATADSGADIRPVLRGRKDRIFGVGPDFNIFVPHIGAIFTARYVPEFAARNTTQGHNLFFSLTFIVKPLTPPDPAQTAAP